MLTPFIAREPSRRTRRKRKKKSHKKSKVLLSIGVTRHRETQPALDQSVAVPDARRTTSMDVELDSRHDDGRGQEFSGRYFRQGDPWNVFVVKLDKSQRVYEIFKEDNVRPWAQFGWAYLLDTGLSKASWFDEELLDDGKYGCVLKILDGLHNSVVQLSVSWPSRILRWYDSGKDEMWQRFLDKEPTVHLETPSANFVWNLPTALDLEVLSYLYISNACFLSVTSTRTRNLVKSMLQARRKAVYRPLRHIHLGALEPPPTRYGDLEMKAFVIKIGNLCPQIEVFEKQELSTAPGDKGQRAPILFGFSHDTWSSCDVLLEDLLSARCAKSMTTLDVEATSDRDIISIAFADKPQATKDMHTILELAPDPMESLPSVTQLNLRDDILPNTRVKDYLMRWKSLTTLTLEARYCMTGSGGCDIEFTELPMLTDISLGLFMRRDYRNDFELERFDQSHIDELIALIQNFPRTIARIFVYFDAKKHHNSSSFDMWDELRTQLADVLAGHFPGRCIQQRSVQAAHAIGEGALPWVSCCTKKLDEEQTHPTWQLSVGSDM